MRSFIAALRTLVLPFGATTGNRIVLDGVDGQIIVYGSDGSYISLSSQAGTPEIAFAVQVPALSTGLGLLVAGYDGAAGTSAPFVILSTPSILPANSPAQIKLESTSSDGSILSFVEFTANRYKLTPGNFNSPIEVDIVGGAVNYADTNSTPEPWNFPVLLNGWVLSGDVKTQYKRLASPPNSIYVIIAVKNGTKTNGTALFNLPAAAGSTPSYRPVAKHLVDCAVDVTVAGSPRLSFQTNGDVTIDNCTSATFIFFEGTIALDAT